MKHNKLLEVAHNKTQRQCDAIRTFLRNNKQSVTSGAGSALKIQEENSIEKARQAELQDNETDVDMEGS